MTTVASLAGIATLIGEPTRTAMLVALMDGRALTAGELARAAGVAPPTASGHLAQLHGAGLLALEVQGRHRYYRLAGPAVAATLEQMMALSGALAAPVRPIATGPRDRALRRARLCYDHLAGEIAVGIADSMVARGFVEFGPDGGAVSGEGRSFLAALGVEAGAARDGARFCRPCLDWSERRAHIAGRIGRALYTGFVAQGWVRAPKTGRAVEITVAGARAFERHFGIAAQA